jgi:hypothetical protein
VEDLQGTLKVQAFAGPVVELADRGRELLGRDLGQVRALGQVLTQQAIGILVGAAFPGVVGMGEVDGEVEFLFEFERPGKLAAIVQSQTLPFLGRESADRLLKLSGHRRSGTGLDLAGDGIAAGPIHTRQHDAPVAFTEEGIAFPIPETLAFVGRGGPHLDGAFAENLALAGGLAVGFAPGLGSDGGLTREAQHGVTFASRSVVSLFVCRWGRCPQTPGI